MTEDLVVYTDKLVHGCGLAASTAEAKRLRESNAVRVLSDGTLIPITDPYFILDAETTEIILKVGKHFRRVVRQPF